MLVHVQSHLDEPLTLDDRAAPALEIYRNSPMDTPPEKLLTDVCMPVV